MKINFRSGSTIIAGIAAALAISVMSLAAQDSSATAATPLSYGVPDVLKLSQAKVADDTIVSYIQNSGTSYGGLNASEIVYLHQQGVSDRVVSTMLDQRNKITTAAQAQQVAATSQATYQTTSTPQPEVACVQPATTVTYVQPQPVSTVYVMRDSSPRLVDYGIYPRYPYYGSYYYGYYPSVSLGLSFSGGHVGFRGGGFHGGSRGGWHGRHH